MKVQDEVIVVLSASTCAGNTLRLPDKLDRERYLQVAKVIEACGGKWNRKLKAHLFPDDAEAHIETVLNTGEVTTARDIGFFPTPEKLAEYLVELAGVTAGDRVLEPSAGTGRIVAALRGVNAIVHSVERDASMARVLETKFGNTTCADFLDIEPTRFSFRFAAVVMNPPFGKVGKGDHLDHVRHAYTMLRPGGSLAAIMPASITFRIDRRYSEFSGWIDQHGGRIIKLPEGSFKESGTNVNTCVLQLSA